MKASDKRGTTRAESSMTSSPHRRQPRTRAASIASRATAVTRPSARISHGISLSLLLHAISVASSNPLILPILCPASSLSLSRLARPGPQPRARRPSPVVGPSSAAVPIAQPRGEHTISRRRHPPPSLFPGAMLPASSARRLRRQPLSTTYMALPLPLPRS